MDLLNENITHEIRKDNCFDFLRYLFAFSLILAHFCTLTGIEQFWFITGSMRVKAFFTITGFLVTYSFLRRDCDILSYTKKRFARIIPAYITTIIFCMLVGWLVTSHTTADFWSSKQTWVYFFSNIFMANWLEPELPNTFQDNLWPQMDGSLWSMKHEVIFYFMVPFLIWSMKKIGKRIISIPVIILCLIIYPYTNVQTQYFTFFIGGMTLMLFFDIYNKYLKYILPASLVLFAFSECESLTFPIILVGVAYHCKSLNFFRKFDNITYGLFLYHFPIIQLLIHYGVAEYSLPLCFLLTIIITSILATLSWFYIEKPLMNRCA